MIIAIVVLGLIGCLAGYFISANKTEASTIITVSDNSPEKNVENDITTENEIIPQNNNLFSSDMRPEITFMFRIISFVSVIGGVILVLFGVIRFVMALCGDDGEEKIKSIFVIFLGLLLMSIKLFLIFVAGV